jgi:hypothetical protein
MPLSSAGLVKRASTAVTRSSSCLYSVSASDCVRVAMMFCSTMGQTKCLALLQMKSAYGDMHFVYGISRAAVVEYWQRYPLRTSANVCIALRQTGSLQRANAECGQRRADGEVLTAV